MDTCLPNSQNFLAALTGSLSTPSAQNPTVAMIEAAYLHHGLNARYINCEVTPDALEAAVRGAVAMGWCGFNCSLPHKVEVIKYLDELGESARLTGAVNCVVIRNGRLTGQNTDGQGFMRSLKSMVNPSGKSMLIFGAGGAARAIVVEAILAGVGSILVVNRNPVRGKTLVKQLGDATKAKIGFAQWSPSFHVPDSTDIVVNATSIGLYPDVGQMLDLDFSSLKSYMVVADVIPNPPRTGLLLKAEQVGCKVLDGLGMLVNQGVASVKYWTDIDVEAEVMRAKLAEIFFDLSQAEVDRLHGPVG